MQEILSQLKRDDKGLFTAVIQDHQNKDVLMVGFMNDEAFEKTVQGPHVWFYSRSKQRLWKKGESSGHLQTVKEVRLDCDGDALLILVEQNVAACHVGYRSCFYRKLSDGRWVVDQDKVF